MEKGICILLLLVVQQAIAQSIDEMVAKKTPAEMLYDSMQASTFNKIFTRYERSRLLLDARERDILESYRTSKDLNEKATNALCREWLKNDIAIDKLKKRYYRKLRRATSPSLASRYVLYEKIYVSDR